MSTPAEQTFNTDVQKWAKPTADQVKAALAGVGARDTGRLIREVKVRYGKSFGQVNRISFIFPRYLVHVEKGSGRGHGGRKGSKWFSNSGTTTKKDGSVTQGQWRRTNPRSFGKMGTGGRRARPTFNPTMDKRVPVLLDLMANFWAEQGIEASTNFNIK